VNEYNIFRWYRSGWGRYTQVDPMGLYGGLNLYGYVSDNPLTSVDPLGLVRVTTSISRRGPFDKTLAGMPLPGGRFDERWSAVSASSKCHCEAGSFYVRLSAAVDLAYISTGAGPEAIEYNHANMASAFVVRAAQSWNRFERIGYSSLEACKQAGDAAAADLQANLLNPGRWPGKLLTDYLNASDNYEDTHHGICRPFPAQCGAY
jgi:uncharacterized protein RhaS with RHS repeats